MSITLRVSKYHEWSDWTTIGFYVRVEPSKAPWTCGKPTPTSVGCRETTRNPTTAQKFGPLGVVPVFAPGMDYTDVTLPIGLLGFWSTFPPGQLVMVSVHAARDFCWEEAAFERVRGRRAGPGGRALAAATAHG